MKQSRLLHLKKELGEKCGIVAVYSSDKDAPALARRALSALQHRGQESAGMTVLQNDGSLKTFKGMGLIPLVMTDSILSELGDSQMAIAHNRYSTSGNSTLANAQPFTYQNGKHAISIGHNGNIPDVESLKSRVKMKLEATSDTSLVAALLLEQREKHSSWRKTFEDVLSTIPAAYSFVFLTDEGIFAARDIYGIRPMCIGMIREVGEVRGYIVASESVALDIIGAEYLREVARGELLQIDKEGVFSSSFFGEPKQQKADIFERIYFSRPDSFHNEQRIREGREESGRRLGKRIAKKGIKIDVVVPIFDSGYPAAKGTAAELKLPLVEAITTSHYVGRTFIRPGQQNRIAAVNGKHNIISDGIVGKRVLFVDDSGVRLTTSTAIAAGLRLAGAKEVHAAFASPPVVNHCDMGIDMKSKSELPASQWENEPFEEIEKKASDFIQADSATYLPIEETSAAFGKKPSDFYYFPFGGSHPVRGEQPVFPKMKKKLGKLPKLAVFVSGGGTNLQKIIDEIESGALEAQIVSVVSNDENAGGVERAKKHKLPVAVFPSKGKLTDKSARLGYNKQLLSHLESIQPDLVVLAGWMIILDDTLLLALQEKEIPVINLHPALLGGREDRGSKGEYVNTSKGKIPAVAGTLSDVFEKVFKEKLLVSGVSVHQVLPKTFDSGPVILKEEVARVDEESKEEYEKRLHEAEYRTLPTAIKRVLHVMKQGIDISRGEFPW